MIEFRSHPIFLGNPPLVANAWEIGIEAETGVLREAFLQILRDTVPMPADVAVDWRINRLRAGEYPCRPGWHHDNIAKGGGLTRYAEPTFASAGAMVAIDAQDAPTGAMTEVLEGDLSLPWPVNQPYLNEVWNDLINRNVYRVHPLRSGEVCLIDGQTFHRGVPSRLAGVRGFLRATWMLDGSPVPGERFTSREGAR